jgi:hypothetical protein
MADTPNLGGLIKAVVLWHFGTCVKCRRPYVGAPDTSQWSLQALANKYFVGWKCPDCQTLEDRAELVIREVEGKTYHLEGLRLVENPKPAGGDDDPQTKAS